MTIVVVYKDSEEIHCWSDTQISTFNNAENSSEKQWRAMTDMGGKLLPLHVIVRHHPNPKSKRPEKEWTFDMGFAFAGSTLIGNSVYAAASGLCSNIYTNKSLGLPDLRQVAEFVREAFDQIVRKMSEIYRAGGSECIVFGYCARARNFRVFRVFGKIEDNKFSSFCEESEGERTVTWIGEKAEFQKRYEEARQKMKMFGTPINPQDIVLAMVADKDVPTVGGKVVYANCQRKKFEIKPMVGQIDDETAEISMFGLNLDLVSNYGAPYTIGNIRPGAKLHGYYLAPPGRH